MLQCCELLKHGYPTRIGYAEIRDRYVPLLPPSALPIDNVPLPPVLLAPLVTDTSPPAPPPVLAPPLMLMLPP